MSVPSHAGDAIVAEKRQLEVAAVAAGKSLPEWARDVLLHVAKTR